MEEKAPSECDNKASDSELYDKILSRESGNLNDAIGAYFKHRCASSRESFLNDNNVSERESSVGLLDVDNISDFGDVKGSDSIYSTYLRNLSTVEMDQKELKFNMSEESENNTLTSDSDKQTHYDKQKALARQVLSSLSEKDVDASLNACDFTKESIAQKDDTEVQWNKKKSLSIGGKSKWFQPNCSPNTPRKFNDELNSLGGDETDFTIIQSGSHPLKKNESTGKINRESLKNSQNDYKKCVNRILKDLNHININQDLEFDSCTPEEQINRLQEDEKKFKSDTALSHNSEISQFSGQEETDNSALNGKSDRENKENNQSIGQYFALRSHRVSSLMGLETDVPSRFSDSRSDMRKSIKRLAAHYDLVLEAITRNSTKSRKSVSYSASISDIINDLKGARNSNESASSNSVVMIQEFLSKAEPELTPNALSDKLLNLFGNSGVTNSKPVQAEKPQIIVTPSNNVETPKSSKAKKRKELNSKTNAKQQNPNQSAAPTGSTSAKVSLSDLQILTPKSEVDSTTESTNCSRKEEAPTQNSSNVKPETFSRMKVKKFFDASTPKVPKRKNVQSKFLKNSSEVEWDLPSISSVQMANDNAEDGDVTLVNINCGKVNKSITTPANATVCNIEDTIVHGDLTLISKRIAGMKEESVCIAGSAETEEPVLLTVIEKLAAFPKGSVDCTALIPLLRDQFPELLSAYSPVRHESSFSNLSTIEEEDLIMSEPGSWVKLPAQVGYNEKIQSLIEVKKSIFIPLINITKKWLMMSLDSACLVQHNSNKKSEPVKILECSSSDFINVIMKDTLVPPESHQNLQVDLVSLVEAKLDLRLKISLKQMFGTEVQVRSLLLRTTTMNTANSLQVLSEESINFGIMANECCDFRTVQICFNGISELPLLVSIEEKNSESLFSFKSANVSPSTDEEVDFEPKKFYYVFKEGEKQLLEFQVLFEPELAEFERSAHQIFEASLILKIAETTVSDGILKRIPMKSTVGRAKFLFSPSCNPIIFNATERGQLMQKWYPVKNVGTLPIAFSMKVIKEENDEKDDDHFVVAKSFFLSTNEESAIEVTYRANEPVRRILTLQIEPNGRRSYKIELIGEIISPEAKCQSPPKSITSVSTKSAFSCDYAPAKIVATTRSLTWPAVALDKDVKQTLQVRNDSDLNLTARIYFRNNTNSFKFLNEDGERVQKLRKVLKPHQPFLMTVIFQPDSLGIHYNAIFLETVEVGVKKIKVFALSGIGGLPHITVSNTKTDLSGCKMLVLQKPTINVNAYCNKLLFKNTGPFPGFVVIHSTSTLFLNNELDVHPSCFIIDSESSVEVSVSQKLKSIDIHGLLSDKDICKLANLTITMGDELSRLRFKELVETGRAMTPSVFSQRFLSHFVNEKKVNVERFKDTQAFVKYFFKSVNIIEIIVTVEKSDTCEPTILLDEDDDVSLYQTVCTTVPNPFFSKVEDKTSIKSGAQQTNAKSDSDNSLSSNSSCPTRKKIQDWLENIELYSQ